MKKDVVMIPSFQRPEFLTITLECIAKNSDSQEYLYLFCLNTGFDPDLLQVIEDFKGQGHSVKVRKIVDNKYDVGRLSYNLFSGYEMAKELCNEFVFMIEEDVFVSDDFFRWSKEVHKAEPDIFCSIASKNHNTRYETNDDLNSYYLSHLDYQCWAECFRKNKLNLFLKHATHQYYNDPKKYVARRFPKSSIENRFAEHDGVVRRVQEQRPQHPIAFPHVPRAFHGGFYGANRSVEITGTLSERIEKVKKICFNDTELKKVTTAQYYQDSRPENLNIDPWTPPLKRAPATRI